MITRILPVSAVAGLLAGVLISGAGSAGAVGAGTFTKITTPSHTTTFKFDSSHPSGHHLTVAGITSVDVTSVDIDCNNNSSTGAGSQTLAAAVPVTGGTFSTNLNLSVLAQCRLRA